MDFWGKNGGLWNFLFIIKQCAKSLEKGKIKKGCHWREKRYMELIYIQKYLFGLWICVLIWIKAVEASIANFNKLGIQVSDKFVNKENTVVIQCKEFQKFEPEVLPNLVLSNLPYGERLSNTEELKSLYKWVWLHYVKFNKKGILGNCWKTRCRNLAKRFCLWVKRSCWKK